MLQAGRGRLHEAAGEFGAAESLGSQLATSHALANQVTGWLLATRVSLGMTGEARAALAAMADERAGAGEIRNARAVICLADGDPAGALGALRDVLDGTAPVIGYVTVVEAQLLAGLAYRALGHRRAADQSAERALALADADRLVLPFAMTVPGRCWRPCRGTRPRTPRCSPTSSTSCAAHPPSLETGAPRRRRRSSARTSAASTPSSVPRIAPRRSTVPASCGSSRPPAR